MNNKLNYFNSLLQKKSKSEMIAQIKDSPIKQKDVDFFCDVVNQFSYNELMEKYSMSLAGCYQRKMRCIEIFFNYIKTLG